MNANVTVSTEQTVIPRAVTVAIEEVRSAVIRQHDAGQRLLESIVRLYLACKEADIRMTVRELARQTECSPSYLSQAWRATDKAVAKRRPALEEAGKLGFNKYVKKYVVTKSRTSQPKISITVVDEFAEFRETVRQQFSRLSSTEQDQIVADLDDLIDELRRQLPQTTERQRETHRRQARH